MSRMMAKVDKNCSLSEFQDLLGWIDVDGFIQPKAYRELHIEKVNETVLYSV